MPLSAAFGPGAGAQEEEEEEEFLQVRAQVEEDPGQGNSTTETSKEEWVPLRHRAARFAAAAAAMCLVAVAARAGDSRTEAPASIPLAAREREAPASPGQGLVQLFPDMARGPDGRTPAAPRQEEMRQLQDLDVDKLPWLSEEAEGSLKCTVDVTQAVAFLGQAVVFLYKASEVCPEGDKKACGISVSVVLTCFSWVASFLSLAAESCRESLNAPFNGLGAICSADITAFVADMFEIISASQAVGGDCDFGPDGPWEQWQHGSAVKDLISKIRQDRTTTPEVLEKEYAKLGLLKKHGAKREWIDLVGPLGGHSKIYSLRALEKQFHREGGHSWWPGWPHKAAPEFGRRLADGGGFRGRTAGRHELKGRPGTKVKAASGAVPEFLEEAKEAREERLVRNHEQMARNYDIAQCVFDVTQVVSRIVRATYQIHQAAESCPDPTACSVSVLTVISAFAWITQFTSLAVGDCAVESFQKAYCAQNVANLIAATSNGAAVGVSIPNDCSPNPTVDLGEDER